MQAHLHVLDLTWITVFNATFNNILVTSLWLTLLVEEIGVPGENHHAQHAKYSQH